MPRKVIEGVKSLIRSRQSNLDHLMLSWFGGEPLAAFPVIQEISTASIEYFGKSRLDGTITTNGYLLSKDKALELLSFGVRLFHISLDGLEQNHNETRRLANGGPTFDRIWENLLALKSIEQDFTLNLRVHYSARNFDLVGALVHRLNESFADDPRVKVYFTSINQLGGANDKLFPRLTTEEKKKIEADLNQDLHPSLRRPSNANFGSHYVCYAALGNSLGIRSDGSIVKCTVALDSPANNIGFLREDGTLSVVQERFRKWIGSTLSGDFKQASCPAKAVLTQATT